MSYLTNLLQAPFRAAGYEPYRNEGPGMDFLGFNFAPINRTPTSGPTAPLDYSQSANNLAAVRGSQTTAPTAPSPTPTATSGGTEPSFTPEDERAYYSDQINSLNQLLGITGTQLETGLGNLATQRARLGDERTKAFSAYDVQSQENAQDRLRGLGSVDQFANRSLTSLRRLLQGAGAGSSSVSRELLPHIVARGAGTRREGVLEQAGRNERNIFTARKDAEDQFRFGEEDLGTAEGQFRTGITNKQLDLNRQVQALEIQRAMADGSSYLEAKAAAEASQNTINSRIAELNTLFGQFNPTYRAQNLITPELGKFTVDPAKIRLNQGFPQETRSFLPQIRRRDEEELR